MIKTLKTTGPALIIVAAILWGIDGILRRSLFTLPPSVIVFYEHLIGALLILPFTLKASYKETIRKKEWAVLLWVSLLSGLIGTLLFTAALIKVNFISFSVVFLLQKLQPLFATLAAVFVLKEKITSQYLKWALLAILAAYFVTFPNGQVNLITGTGTITAALMAVGAAFAWGSSTAFSRLGLLKLSHTLMTGLRFLITAPLALIAVFLLNNQSSLLTLESSQILRLLIIALSTGMVALWIYYKGLKTTQAKISTILELAFPLTAIIIDLVFYKNTLTLSQYTAALVLIFAIHQISRLNRKS